MESLSVQISARQDDHYKISWHLLQRIGECKCYEI